MARRRGATRSASRVEAAAHGVYTLINTTMANAVRYISVERGKDPREFALVVAGGAGPLHAGPIAAELDIPLVLDAARVLSLLRGGDDHLRHQARLRAHDHPRARRRRGRRGERRAGGDGRERDGRRCAPKACADGDITVSASADLHYVGQFHEVEVAGTGRSRSTRGALA